jgi:hypothetical protein
VGLNSTLGDAIDKYIAMPRKEIGKTKAQVLRSIRPAALRTWIAPTSKAPTSSQHLYRCIAGPS